MINGIYAATLSLLNEDLGLDIKNTISHAEKVIDNGCHGVVFFWKYRPISTNFFSR